MFGLNTELTVLLLLCIIIACIFEFINGFHDTANAVATVIYTKSLKPFAAVIWSGIWNFIGVYVGGLAVAMGIINLLPVEALVDANIYHNISLILALILTAVIWNLGTWYLGIPCSSSHTLIGSIFGVGIALLLITKGAQPTLNWHKITDAGLSLLISPIIGFFLAFLTMLLFKRFLNKDKFFKEPDPKKAPPFGIRSILILTSATVSLSHGSNDGQKGIGLLMIILICFLPAKFAIDNSKNPATLIGNVDHIEWYIGKIDKTKMLPSDTVKMHEIKASIVNLKEILGLLKTPDGIDKVNNFQIRKDIIKITKHSASILECKACKDCSCLNLTPQEKDYFKKDLKEMKVFIEFAPWWAIFMISLSLGLGTMIGWKRIVLTIGERIGKSHMSYAHGASAQIVATATISLSTVFGLPVSTTHVLSSGVAGTMVSSGGIKNLQKKTITNILLTWVITIPVTIILAAFLYILLHWIFLQFDIIK
jgi:low-affinity inorganic phosphate transporter